MKQSNLRDLTLFVLLSAAVIVGVVAYGLISRRQVQSRQPAVVSSSSDNASQLDQVRQRPHLLFRNTALGASYGHICVAALDAPDGVRYSTGLTGERVYGTSSAGLCLQASRRALTTYKAASFNGSFEVLHPFQLAGGPSRVRVSSNGRLGASTVFVAGDSYASTSFSTRTTIFDLKQSTVIGDLEEFTVRKSGQLFRAADFNFWGVTFANDGDTFYATLASGGVFYLVEGLVSRRELQILRTGVECPSLSPDGTKVAFKSRTSQVGSRLWRLHVLNLKTQAETVLSEVNSVDDQVEWLDADHVLYALSRNTSGSGTLDTWVVAADGTGEPRVFIHDAASPCVVRP